MSENGTDSLAMVPVPMVFHCFKSAEADLRTDPRLDSLRGHPRFQALLKKVGLDEWPK